TVAFKIGSDTTCTAVRQVLVELQRTSAIGMADDIDAVLVELLEYQHQRVQGRVKATGNICRAAGKGDVARHDQGQVVALALNLDTSALQRLAQLGFLGIDVITVATSSGTTNCRADQRTLGTILLARRRCTDHGATDRAYATVDTGLARFALACIGVGRTAGQ